MAKSGTPEVRMAPSKEDLERQLQAIEKKLSDIAGRLKWQFHLTVEEAWSMTFEMIREFCYGVADREGDVLAQLDALGRDTLDREYFSLWGNIRRSVTRGFCRQRSRELRIAQLPVGYVPAATEEGYFSEQDVEWLLEAIDNISEPDFRDFAFFLLSEGDPKALDRPVDSQHVKRGSITEERMRQLLGWSRHRWARAKEQLFEYLWQFVIRRRREALEPARTGESADGEAERPPISGQNDSPPPATDRNSANERRRPR